MAVKTVILRPISVTTSNESLVSFYPSDTTLPNAHLLVNEEVADDDSTYIVGGLGGNVNYHFSFTKPNNLKDVADFSFIVRSRVESGTGDSTSYSLHLQSNKYSLLTVSNNSTSYVDSSDATSTDIKTSIVADLNATTSNLEFYISQDVATGTNKSKPTRVTQIYVIITYNDNNDDVFYMKKGGSWIKLGNTILWKYNNTWSSLNLGLIANNSKFYVKEV